MAKNLEDMDDEEFMAEWTEASQEAEAAKARIKEFVQEQKRRDAKRVLDDMPDEQKKMLAQYLSTEGIASEEAVHNG